MLYRAPILVVLTYHEIRIDPQASGSFARLKTDFSRDMEQILLLGYPIVDFKTAMASGIDRDSVVVTFDDGVISQVEHAVPVLQELGVPATFFVIGSHINKQPWDFTPDVIRSLHDNPLFAVESHGYRHINLSAEPVNTLHTQFRYARASLSDLGIDSRLLALPYGDENTSLLLREAARQCGFDVVRTSIGGAYLFTESHLNVPSYTVKYESDVPALLDRRRRWPNAIPQKTQYD